MAREVFDWFEEDAKLVQEEAERQIAEQKRFLAAEDCLIEWDIYLHGLTEEEHKMAIRGLQEHAEAYLHERNIEAGWHKVIDTSD